MQSTHFKGLALVVVLVLGTLARAETKTLFEKKSPFNQVRVTEDDDGQRKLVFEDGATQSAMDTKDPNRLVLAYARAIMSGLAACPRPQRVLIVGLGGALMPNFLRKCYPELQINIAELDPLVAEVATRFFNFKEDQRMKVYLGDGRKFIESTANRYDIIFLDAYGADSIPYMLATKEFLAACREKLTESGIVVSNVWGSADNKLYWSMVKTYLALYGELHIVRAPGSQNRILIALQNKPAITREQLAAAAGKLEPKPLRDLGLEAIVAGGYEPVELPREAKVLLDADAPKE